MKRTLLGAVLVPFLVMGAAAAGCAGSRGATQQALAGAQTTFPEGMKIYADTCAICHGNSGEGGPGSPPVMGAGALPVRVRQKYDSTRGQGDPNSPKQRAYQDSLVPGSGERELRMRFRTVKDIHTFMVEQHPPMNASLEPEQYWQVLSYVLSAHGLKVPASGLNDSNAESILNER